MQPFFSFSFILSLCFFCNIASGNLSDIDFSSGSISPGSNQDRKCNTDDVIIQKILNGYDKNKLPISTGLQVEVEWWIQQITEISDVGNFFEIDLYSSEQWLDSRLQFSHLNPCKSNITLSHEAFARIWTPVIAFVNSKQAWIYESPLKNIFALIHLDGKVWMTKRLKLRASCESGFSNFPMDAKKCQATFQTYFYNHDEVNVKWSNSGVILMSNNTHVSGFTLESMHTKTKKALYPAGYWDEVIAIFKLKRALTPYLLKAYIPSMLILVVSWTSFALGKATAARAVLGSVSLLAMLIIYLTITKTLPEVTHGTAFDVWCLSCISFIVLSIIELAVVEYLTSDTNIEKNAGKIRGRYSSMSSRKLNPETIADVIDKISRFAFPAFFIVFNIGYWIKYIAMAEDFDPEV